MGCIIVSVQGNPPQHTTHTNIFVFNVVCNHLGVVVNVHCTFIVCVQETTQKPHVALVLNQGRHDKTCAFIERTLCKVPNPHSSCNARSCTPFRTYGKTHKPCFSRHVAKGVQSRALKRSYATLVVRMIQHWYCVL